MRSIFTLLIICLLPACASTSYTVDDGRKVNEDLLGHIRSYGEGEKVLRPAIVRSASLKDSKCDTQWELPFSVASSYGESADDRIAWVRGLGVDERLTVVGTSPDSPLQRGDKILKVGAFDFKNTDKMQLLLTQLRDSGTPFPIQLSTNKIVKVVPFKVCRGYSRWAPPASPTLQSYHWKLIVQPLEVAQAGLSDDEALWVVLWAQGLSEEGGARMKTYHYGTGFASTLFTLATLSSSLQAASLSSEAELSAVRSTASRVATDVIGMRFFEHASATAHKISLQQAKNAMQRAAANRASLSGIAWAASTVFEEADAWAYTQLEKLHADPLASFSLHQKLIARGATSNSMIFDEVRLKALNKLAEERGKGAEVNTILQGLKPEDL